MTKTAIITGATGYIGSNLLEALVNENWRITIIVRKNSSFDYIKKIKDRIAIFEYDGCIEKLTMLFSKIKPDIVFHIASKVVIQHSASDIDDMLESNIRFGTQLLEAMVKTGTVNIVNTGTSWQHYQNAEYNPVNLYAASKQAFMAILQYYSESSGIRSITLELFETYGPNDKRCKIINLLIESHKNNLNLDMTPGEQELDFVFIDDVIRGYMTAANILIDEEIEKINKIFSICTNKPIKLKELVNLYEKINNIKLPINWGGRPYRKREVMKVCDRGIVLTGWKPKIQLEEGLNRLKLKKFEDGGDK